MKELSIEQKAKAYDEAKARMSRAWNDNRCTIGFMNEIFPELKESENEQHRKWILEYLYDSLRKSDEQFKDQFKRAIDWLEKQGEYKSPEEILKIRQELYQSGYNDGYKHGCEDTKKEDENPIDKVEPKFHVNEWVVTDKNNVVQIKAVNNGYYTIDNGMDFSMSYVDKCWHKWAIQDAKDGDVLSDVYGNIGIFEKHDDFDWTSYCSLGCNGGFRCFRVEHEIERTHPATKEQRDLLFEKMEEAGYWWDEDNLELKEKFFKTPEESLGITSEEYSKIVNDCLFGDDKPNFRERYEHIKDSEWFKKTHENMSVSDDDKEDAECKCIKWDNESFNRILSEMSDKLDKLYELVGEVKSIKQLIKHFYS